MNKREGNILRRSSEIAGFGRGQLWYVRAGHMPSELKKKEEKKTY